MEKGDKIASENFRLVMAQALIDRALDDLDQADKNGGIFWLNKQDFNDSLRLARKIILESYVD